MVFGALPTHQAMGTALFSFFFTGILAAWAFQRYGSIDWKITIPVCVGSFISAFAGAFAGALAPAKALNLLLAAIIILSSLYSMLPSGKTSLAAKLDARGNRRLLFAVGLLAGFLCGMTGAGGGVVSLPVMLILGYPPLASIGTGQVLQSIVAASGSASNYANGFIDFSLVWPVTVCELAGIVIGVRVAHAAPMGLLKKAVALVCLAIGAFIAIGV